MNDNYREIPALAVYIDRVGAEQLNYRRFMIKDHKGHYYTERCLIKISPEGDITCSKKEYAPTKEEAANIKQAVLESNWPKAIGAKNIDALLKKSKANKSNLFLFWSRRDKTITMVQERKTMKDGTKAYLPWTFFNDGQWRCMEPDGQLPFWKPKEKRPRLARIMIHEGAKAATFVDWLVNDAEAAKAREQHPWSEELAEYEHWGIIGGALAPHRADYEELRREKAIEVVYICDNDHPGKDALTEVSRNWGRALKAIKFDNNWPQSWDMADEFTPKTCPKLYNKKGSYIGPSLIGLMNPATWATESSINGPGRPVLSIRQPFREEWLHCVRPDVYIHRSRPNHVWIATEFNSFVQPFSDAGDTARLLRSDQVSKGAVLSYEPNKEPGLYGSVEQGYYINTHVPTHIKPRKGDIKLWSHYLEHMFPVEQDRLEMMRWCATLIARPDVKMFYGCLLISETQGVGKTTLGEKILAPLMGADNVSYPSEADITDSNFNYWSAHKRLAIVNEIYAGHSSKAYDKLKSVITDKIINVSKKYQANYEIANWLHVFACSNSIRALRLSDDDRRWFVPKVTEEKQPTRYWERFNAWLINEHGLGIIRWWAHEWLKKNDAVRQGDPPPWSTAKQEVIDEAMSPGMELASFALDYIRKVAGDAVIVADLALINMIKDIMYEGRHNDRLERPLTIRKLAKAKGWFIHPERVNIQSWCSGNRLYRIICGNRKLAETPVKDLLSQGVKHFDPAAIPRPEKSM
ncbi:MAG: DUF5906 domain-containing protein [Nitrososphaera sp.]|nr:DUF5906 domain-containing protein [Nitrososphaera sp.]